MAAIDNTTTGSAPNRGITKEERKVIFASSLGTVFEWYDFYLYGSLAAIIAKQSEVTGAITERMTLTLAGLLRSKSLILLITGDEKLAVLRAAQAGTDIKEMPIRAVLQQQTVPVVVYWAP